MMYSHFVSISAFAVLLLHTVEGFTTAPVDVRVKVLQLSNMQQHQFFSSKMTTLSMSDSDTESSEAVSQDPSEIIGRRILVTGDVNGGYVRTCITNEAGRFRRLLGVMTPPDDSKDEAEIYVEGKRKQVDAFIRWCKRGSKSVGLSQKLNVVDVIEEDPTGLYDGFYVKTK